MPLTPTQEAGQATNRGPLAQTIKPMADPATGDQDVRDMPSNGAIPDEAKNLIPGAGYHVP